MVDFVMSFAAWYWNSKLGFLITFLILLPIGVWEIVKRMPQRRFKSKKKRLKK